MFRSLPVALLLTLAVACAPTRSPEFTVLGVHDDVARRDVVVVQVTNPANRPMRLTKLEYTFASGSNTVAQGELELSRDIPANSAVVVEVPFEGEAPDGAKVTLRGTLTAELDRILQKFKVSAEVTPISTPK